MEFLIFVGKIVLILTVISAVINYVVIFISTKFNVFNSLIYFFYDDGDGFEPWYFFAPFTSWMACLAIVVYLLVKLVFEPIYSYIFVPLFNVFKYLSKLLFKPILKADFKNKLNESK